MKLIHALRHFLGYYLCSTIIINAATKCVTTDSRGLASGQLHAQLIINDRSQDTTSTLTQVTKNTREKSIKDSNGKKASFRDFDTLWPRLLAVQ